MDILRQNVLLTDEDQIRWFAKLANDKKQVLFAITEEVSTEKSDLVGYCGLTNLDFVNRRGEVSFVMKTEITHDEAEYEAYFLAVLEMLKKYAFEELKLHKLFTETYEFRKFHISILEKFGFKLDGRYKEHIFHEGKFIDSLIHSLING